MIQQQSTVECTDKNNVEITSEKQQDLKQSFVIYSEWEENCTLLSNEQRGQLFSAILAYGGRGEDISSRLDGVTAMCFSFIKNQLKRDAEKYQSTIKRNSENGKKGGRPKKKKTMHRPTDRKKLKPLAVQPQQNPQSLSKRKAQGRKKPLRRQKAPKTLGILRKAKKTRAFFKNPKKPIMIMIMKMIMLMIMKMIMLMIMTMIMLMEMTLTLKMKMSMPLRGRPKRLTGCGKITRQRWQEENSSCGVCVLNRCLMSFGMNTPRRKIWSGQSGHLWDLIPMRIPLRP